ncbi:hypothetical protein BDW75DRAFT_235280 [Aspergillus navahoensis]
MLMGYQGRISVNHIVLEKDSGITTDPRGIALEEDGVRLIGSWTERSQLGRVLEMDYSTAEGGTGHKHLRGTMASSGFCQLRSNCTVIEIQQDDDWTYCRAFYDVTWVALNWEITLRTVETHSDSPLWRLGYTPKQVYDLFFPANFRLSQDVQYPEDCIRVLSCNKWSHGRVVLFGGQGTSSGFRDAASLAWRLALLCRQSTLDSSRHEAVLKNWHLERKLLLENSLVITNRDGEFAMGSNWLKIFLRSCYLSIMNLVPSWRRQLRLGHRKGIVHYQFSPGMPFIPDLNGALCLPQVYCKPRAGTLFFTDDLLIYLEEFSEPAPARQTVFAIEGYSKGEIYIDDATYLIQDTDWSFDSSDDHDSTNSAYQLASANHFARSPLCDGRPDPQYYDMYYLGKVLGGRKYVIVRPGRFIFAACSSLEELQRAVVDAVEYLQS